jgi:hypothetical protein
VGCNHFAYRIVVVALLKIVYIKSCCHVFIFFGLFGIVQVY